MASCSIFPVSPLASPSSARTWLLTPGPLESQRGCSCATSRLEIAGTPSTLPPRQLPPNLPSTLQISRRSRVFCRQCGAKTVSGLENPLTQTRYFPLRHFHHEQEFSSSALSSCGFRLCEAKSRDLNCVQLVVLWPVRAMGVLKRTSPLWRRTAKASEPPKLLEHPSSSLVGSPERPR